MRRIGGHVSSSGGPLTAIKDTIRVGGNCMQFFAGSPRMWKRSRYDQKVADQFCQQVADHDLAPVFIHALYLTNLASDKPDLREKSRRALISDMQNCALLDANGVILHIGSHQGRGFDTDKEMVADEIREVLDQTPPKSRLLLENTAGQKGKIGTLTELEYFLDVLNDPRVGICIDTAHAFEAGHALHTIDGIEKFIDQISQTITIEKINVLHVNDSKTEFNSHHDVHNNIGAGHIGLDSFKHLINHPKLNHLPIILEVPGFDGNGLDQKNIEIMKGLLQ